MFYLTHPSAFAQRTDAVLIFSAAMLAKGAIAHDYGQSGWLDIIGRQIQRVVLGFLALGDRSEQYGAHDPLLDPVTAALVPAAFAVALARIKDSSWLLCVVWAGVALVLGGVLTTYQPDAPRLLAAVPALCLLVGGLAHSVLSSAAETGVRDAKPILALGMAGALVAAGALNVSTYFRTYQAKVANPQVTLITDVGRYLADAPGTRPVVLYNHREFYLSHWTIELLAPQIYGTTVWAKRVLDDTLARQRNGFVLIAVDEPGAGLSQIYSEYPGGKPTRIAVTDTSHWVIAYTYSGAGQV
jgi:hypothetical protein